MRLPLTAIILSLLIAACSQSHKLNDSVEEKVQEILSEMTLQEKIGQMMQVTDSKYKTKQEIVEAISSGNVGSFLNMRGADTINALQKIAVEKSRLGIPLIIGRDVIHGFKTIFPIPLGMASSWNPSLAEEAMEIAAREASSMGINWTFAPMMDVCFDPRWGRIAEGCGEDPYLVSLFAEAMVKGFQGDNPADHDRIAACAKHFVGYGMAEGGRDYNTTLIPEPFLRNVHLRPFKAAADAGVLTMMSAFNDLNGVPTSGNEFTLKTILRDEWKWDGFVVSDWASIIEMVEHGFAEDEKEAGLKAVKAGVDMEMASTSYIDHLAQLIEEGEISEALINERVANILRVKVKLGLFDNPYVDETLAEKVLLTDEHLESARKIARESMVLLKNDKNILPLSKSQTVALIGPMTDAPMDQLGTWVFDSDKANSITPKHAFEEILGTKLNYEVGLEYSRDKSTVHFAAAIKAAKKSDVVVFVAGEESCLSGEASSRGKINLPGKQTELIAKLKATGTPIVLVIMAGRPLVIGQELEMVDAVLYAWHPGTMAGVAITDLLFGDVVPSGKLPVSFVKGEGQIPFYYYHKSSGRPTEPEDVIHIDDIPRNFEQLSLGYTNMDLQYGITPLLPFGFGLSYTTFEYGDVQLSSSELSMDGKLEVKCSVSNTGAVDAEEVVQLYIRDIAASLTRPVKELKGFEKVLIKAGETKEIKFTIEPKELEFFNGKAWVIEPGKFHVWIASDSQSGDFKEFVLR